MQIDAIIVNSFSHFLVGFLQQSVQFCWLKLMGDILIFICRSQCALIDDNNDQPIIVHKNLGSNAKQISIGYLTADFTLAKLYPCQFWLSHETKLMFYKFRCLLGNGNGTKSFGAYQATEMARFVKEKGTIHFAQDCKDVFY